VVSEFVAVPFAGDLALADRILAFLARIQGEPDFAGEYHPGDFVWQGFRPSCRTVIAAWCAENGAIMAVSWFMPPRDIALTIDARLIGTRMGAELIKAMLEEGLTRHAALGSTERYGLLLRPTDTAIQDEVSALGYRASGETWFRSNIQTLDQPISPKPMADGFRIVAMDKDADLNERVEVHRDVWHPSRFTLADYEVLRQAPLYRTDLDLVVQAPDGRYATSVLGWFDPISKTGLLEPVGARADYRRLGLTVALIGEVLRRMQGLGAEVALVNSEDDSAAANALYGAAGFTCATTWQWWERPGD
jgi:GNAT superfamily N-acetyltransferase